MGVTYNNYLKRRYDRRVVRGLMEDEVPLGGDFDLVDIGDESEIDEDDFSDEESDGEDDDGIQYAIFEAKARDL